jgi:EAL domain-containing protein (putative c-di-GMP-specific phosphodiesterase class I)
LQRFVFDGIKLDKSFIHPDQGRARPKLLRSLIALGHDLGVAIIADGLESESEVIEVSQLGSELAQGPAFGAPLSLQDVRKLMGLAPEAA